MTSQDSPPPEPNLHDAYQAGRRCWPSVGISEDEFSNFLSSADLDGGKYFASDLYLACACALGRSTACEILVNQYLKPSVSYLIKRGFAPDVAEEICQTLGEKMLIGDHPRIRTYSGSGDLGAWIRVIAYRMALDNVRATLTEKETKSALANELAAGISSQDPELVLLRTDCASVMRQALEDAIGRLQSRERTLLRLYYVGGLSIDRIAVVFQVHRATAARQIAEVREKLIKSISRTLLEMPGLSESDRRSMNAVARSQMSFELEDLLRSAR